MASRCRKLEAIEIVGLMLDGDGVARTVGAIVAMSQQPGQYEYPGIDGRLLARAAKAGFFVRRGELLMTHAQAAELRQEEGTPAGYVMAVGHAYARSAAAGVGTRTH